MTDGGGAAAVNVRPRPSKLHDVVWEALPLRGLDDRARGDLQLAASRRELTSGTWLFRAGDPADHLYVVERGVLTLSDRSGKVLRRASAGDALGEEALVFAFGSRVGSARCDEAAAVVALPSALLRRVWQRAGTGGHVAKITRAMTRSAMRDSLLASPLRLDPETLEVVLDGARLLEVARGDVILRPHETRRGLFVVIEGVVRLESQTGQVQAHLRGGDVFLGATSERATAGGPAWLTFVEEATLRVAKLDAHARTVAEECEAAARAAHGAAKAAASVALEDLVRLETATSLLVLDGDACVRCGFCASSCKDAHADGRSRLVRRGPIVALESLPAAILPSSCEHCRSPACLPACPTGAIERTESGAISLREDLCTGCGSCAKACPWENLALAPRPGGRGAEPGTSADVAIKCDLCAGTGHGPACVAACPTSALVRIDGAKALPMISTELRRDAPSSSVPLASRRLAPVAILAAVSLAVALYSLGQVGSIARLALGILAAVGTLFLVGYGALKRTAPARRARLGPSFVSAQYILHLVVGAAAFGAVLGHASGGTRATTVARAALAAFFAAATSGGFAAVLYRFLPARISRLTRREWLPEDSRDRARERSERVAAELSGKSDLLKAVFARVLDPYRRSPLVFARLLVTKATLAGEIEGLRRRVGAALEGRGGDKLEGLDRLVDAVVEEACFRAARVALLVLRGFVPIHVAAALVALLLVIVHAASEVSFR
jgi:Fe-S-cluster-containing dehydrogenase component/CRP-like cAMP-binding protein